MTSTTRSTRRATGVRGTPSGEALRPSKKPTVKTTAPMQAGKGFSVVADPSSWLPVKTDIVDGKGEVVGHRQVRDRALLGQTTGFDRIIDFAPGAPLQRIYLDETPRTDAIVAPSWPGSEVRTLVAQGPSKNRIDLTIVGDGYTEAEKDKFFLDAKRITDELFGNDTFKSYLPLFNVHAVFVPSKESGIGDGRSKNTALGLYRHPQHRQAVMPGNSAAAKRATELAPDSDYPILVGNDKFYGGLGGTFAITTSAPLNITTVLRHELGHNFGRVGEEYDGGQVYDGANHSSSSTNLPWQHFVKGQTPVHAAKLLHISAPWKNLGGGEWQTSVTVPENAKSTLLDFSSLGFDKKEDVELLVDGKSVAYDGKFNYDRNFYKVKLELTPGRHTITFKDRAGDGNNILSRLAVYGLPPSFPSDKSVVGAFQSYSQNGGSGGFRPTESDCLMRDMQLTHFCPACQENMWRNFLKEVSLIDAVERNGSMVSAKLVLADDRLQVEWIDPAGKARPELAGKREWQPAAGDVGKWKLRVRFVSDEVKDPKQDAWTVHEAAFEIA